MKRKEWIKQYQALRQELLLSKEKRDNIFAATRLQQFSLVRF